MSMGLPEVVALISAALAAGSVGLGAAGSASESTHAQRVAEQQAAQKKREEEYMEMTQKERESEKRRAAMGRAIDTSVTPGARRGTRAPRFRDEVGPFKDTFGTLGQVTSGLGQIAGYGAGLTGSQSNGGGQVTISDLERYLKKMEQPY